MPTPPSRYGTIESCPTCRFVRSPSDFRICGSQNTVPKLQQTRKKLNTVAISTRRSVKPWRSDIAPARALAAFSRAIVDSSQSRSAGSSQRASRGVSGSNASAATPTALSARPRR
jgi:hypothetical protein